VKAAIFVVDDMLADARTTQRFLERHGHEVTIETSGKEAIRILRTDVQFDVTFLDLLMPDVNGEQVFRALKIYAPARLKRLAFLTGMAYLADTWLARTGVPVIEKGVESPGSILRTVEEFAKLTCSRGPNELREERSEREHKDHSTSRGSTVPDSKDHLLSPQRPPRPSSSPELDALYDEDMEINTDMIQLAQKKGVSSSFITELRIRHLHSSNKSMKDDLGAVKGEVTEVKGAVAKVATDVVSTKTELGTFKTEISTAIKTSFKWLGVIVIILGSLGTAVGWLIEHFLLKK
jgi:CheY-like chemotaxis protein